MRTIKRYANRKLYDTEDKRYITLDQIAVLICEGHEDIRVVDNQTGEDLTTITLSQILLEREKKRETSLPKSFLTNLVKRSTSSVGDYLKRHVFSWFDNSYASDEAIDENVERLVTEGDISVEEGRKIKEEIKRRAGRYKKRLEEVIESRVNDILGKLNIPTKNDLEVLDRRLSDVTSKLDALIAKYDLGDRVPGEHTGRGI